VSGITVVWTNKDPALLDPGKPITTGLKNKEWDNLDFLRQWVGGSYLAGAVQNHDHDGVNSAPIEALPNLVKNGSFERDGGGGVPAGWVFTAYTGGSAAMVTATQKHGKTCVGITSTVLANGGGYYESANYIDVGGGEDYLWKIWRAGSIANISSQAEIIWYDAAEAQISVSALFSISTTETTFTEARGRVAAPATARLAKLRLTGGVPAVGSAVGTVYFDGVMVPDVPRIDSVSIQAGGIAQANIGAAAVGQSQLKTTYGDVSTGTLSPTNLTLPGGAYGFFPQIFSNTGYDTRIGWDFNLNQAAWSAQTFSTSPVATVALSRSGGTSYARQRYVQACEPYNLGDGEVPLFTYLLINATGAIDAIYAGPEAPFHLNGPTDIRAEYYDAMRRGWRWQDIKEPTFAPEDLTDYISAARYAGWRGVLPEEASLERFLQTGRRDTFTNGTLFSTVRTWRDLCAEQSIAVEQVFGDLLVPSYEVVGREQIEITQAMKQRDMAMIPHPFLGNDLTGKTVVLLDPVCDTTWRLAEYHENGVSPNELLHDDYLRIDNTALNRASPPGVMVVPYRWKLT